MDWWMIIAGVALLLLCGYDAISTTMSFSSTAGPLTSLVGGSWWNAARRLSRSPSSPLVTTAGPVIVLLTIALWLALLWGGWTLVFAADPEAVISSSTRQPAGGWSRVYFAGFTVFTLGVGDYIPNGDAWEVLTSVAVMTGLGLTTMAITYLVPVVSAVTDRRVQADTVAGLGDTPAGIVADTYADGGFRYLDHRLPAIAESLLQTAERHLAYPVLHYFHSGSPHVDLRVQLPKLDEALTILQHGLATAGPHPASLSSARHAVQQVLSRAQVDPADSTPAPPDLAPIREAGIPVVDDATFAQRIADLDDHRRQLDAYARESVW